MVLCRPGKEGQQGSVPQSQNGGGPVFVPRRKPSPLAEELLSDLREGVTPYDDLWFAGRPVS